MRILDGLKPQRVFYYFEEISKIPRGSGNEKQVSDYLLKQAENLGLEVIQDDVLNIIIKKNATSGYEDSPCVMIQGHMDMVCEKNATTVHDFEVDPLKLLVEGDNISADGTTLGADNGIAVAMAMALLEANDLQHPALEVLITTDEETGMTGAAMVDGSLFKSSILFNLDCDAEGVLTAGCAGGGRIHYSVPIVTKQPDYKKAYKISVKGLKGGHSGVDIKLERGNANVILSRILSKVMDKTDMQSIMGGAQDNAIPREASAIIMFDDFNAVKNIIDEQSELIQNEYAVTDAGLEIIIDAIDDNFEQVFSDETYKKTISSMLIIPFGPQVKSTKIDLVILSNNIGVVSTDNGYVKIICAARSSVSSLMDFFIDKVQMLADAMGCSMTLKARYPGWEYKKESYIRDLTSKVYSEITGKDMVVEAVHAGLECGLLMEKIEGLDAVSFGPTLKDIHTPDEILGIGSVGRCYNLLCEVLKNIK